MTILSNPTALDRPDELVAIFKDVLAELVSLATPQATATSAAS
jgi:hypothetical protein